MFFSLFYIQFFLYILFFSQHFFFNKILYLRCFKLFVKWEDKMTLESVKNFLCENYPEKIIVDISDYETEEHETYKYLFESFSDSKASLEEENSNLVFKYQELEKDFSVMQKENNELKKSNKTLSDRIISSLNLFSEKIKEPVVVSDVKAVFDGCEEKVYDVNSFINSVSDVPGVYGEHRPSWFTPIGTVLSKESVQKKNINNSSPALLKFLSFWDKKEASYKSEKSQIDIASEYDLSRKENIIELLKSDCSNEEKYLKYYLYSPGLDEEFFKTLEGAAELNLDARLIISFLEQPSSRFNKQVIENYVSRLHKGTEYNLKQELADELIAGKWIITSNVNGKQEEYRIVPASLLDDYINKINELYSFLRSYSGGELSPILEESSPDSLKDEKEIDYSDMEYYPEISTVFDDSML